MIATIQKHLGSGRGSWGSSKLTSVVPLPYSLVLGLLWSIHLWVSAVLSIIGIPKSTVWKTWHIVLLSIIWLWLLNSAWERLSISHTNHQNISEPDPSKASFQLSMFEFLVWNSGNKWKYHHRPGIAGDKPFREIRLKGWDLHHYRRFIVGATPQSIR